MPLLMCVCILSEHMHQHQRGAVFEGLYGQRSISIACTELCEQWLHRARRERVGSETADKQNS